MAKRPDRDPLAVSPHEKFEEASRGERADIGNELDTYENVIRKMAKPVMVTAAEQGLGAWKEITEVIARIHWVYRVPRAQVEADLLTEGNRQLSVAVTSAAVDGLLVDPDGNRIPLDKGLKLVEGEHRQKLLRGGML